MSEATAHPPATPHAFSAPVLIKMGSIGVMLAGLALWGISFTFDKHGVIAWSGWLIASWYTLGLALFATVFLAMNALASGGWAATIKRVPEAMTRYFPVALLPLGVLITGMYGGHLYEWHSDYPHKGLHGELLHWKEPWLNPTAWILRMAVYFGLWTAFSWLMVRHSRRQDIDGDVKHTRSIRKLAGPFCVVFGLSVTFASVDFIKSIEATWFSTMFGVYQFAGIMMSGFSVLVLLLIALRAGGQLREHVNESHFHTLGIWLLSSCVFWAYIWFCQFMLIWYSNIPEETGHYFARWEHPTWFWISFVINPLLNFAIPFLVLLPRPNKRNVKVLGFIALVVLAGRFVDLWQFVAPRPVLTAGVPVPAFEPVETIVVIAPVVALVGLFVFVVMKAMERAPLYATKDPFFQEGAHHHL